MIVMVKCLFLVEGPYDLQRLSLLKGLFDENKLEIVPLEGDKLTTKDYSQNYRETISFHLNRESTHSFEEFDFLAQICDTDGCYIDKSLLIQKSEITKIKYYRTHVDIKEVDPKAIKDEYKRNNICALLSSGEIELFYNSCNIDDAFDGCLNPTKKQKGNLAINMYNKYKDDLFGFIDLLFESDKSNTITYSDSWLFIQQGTNSLLSSSNLKYFLINHIDDLKEEYKLYVLNKIKQEEK